MEIPFSTEEQKIGTWFDGKTLYRKIFIYENITLGANQETRIKHRINNIEDIIDMKVVARLGWEASWCTEAYLTTDVGIISKATSGEFVFSNRSTNNWTFSKLLVMLKYTKTT